MTFFPSPHESFTEAVKHSSRGGLPANHQGCTSLLCLTHWMNDNHQHHELLLCTDCGCLILERHGTNKCFEWRVAADGAALHHAVDTVPGTAPYRVAPLGGRRVPPQSVPVPCSPAGYRMAAQLAEVHTCPCHCVSGVLERVGYWTGPDIHNLCRKNPQVICDEGAAYRPDTELLPDITLAVYRCEMCDAVTRACSTYPTALRLWAHGGIAISNTGELPYYA